MCGRSWEKGDDDVQMDHLEQEACELQSAVRPLVFFFFHILAEFL